MYGNLRFFYENIENLRFLVSDDFCIFNILIYVIFFFGRRFWENREYVIILLLK